MAPDLNSLPPSRSPNQSPLQARMLSSTHDPQPRGSLSPRSSSVSLAAAAAMNASYQHHDSRRSSISSHRNRGSPQISRAERRRSSVLISMNDPAVPGPGELQSPTGRFSGIQPATGDLHHSRAPSLGELHQELEEEQEAQVNRLLQMIRLQQAQIQAMQQNPGSAQPSNTGAVDDSTPTSERSLSFPAVPPHPTSTNIPRTRSPIPRASADLSRQSSRRSQTSSRGASSPCPRPVSGGTRVQSEEWLLSNPERDEIAFYEAETHMLTRENQMLRLRIRELERQMQETNPTPGNTPAIPSNLVTAPMSSTEDSADANGRAADDKT